MKQENATMSDEIRRPNRRGVTTEPEKNSGVPVEAGPGQGHAPSMTEMMKQFIREEVSRTAGDRDIGTFDEEDDFEEEDPQILPITDHEIIAMSTEELQDYAPEGVTLTEGDEAPQEAGPEEEPTPTDQPATDFNRPDRPATPEPAAQAPQEDLPDSFPVG